MCVRELAQTRAVDTDESRATPVASRSPNAIEVLEGDVA
jgi:hypothetical protein